MQAKTVQQLPLMKRPMLSQGLCGLYVQQEMQADIVA